MPNPIAQRVPVNPLTGRPFTAAEMVALVAYQERQLQELQQRQLQQQQQQAPPPYYPGAYPMALPMLPGPAMPPAKDNTRYMVAALLIAIILGVGWWFWPTSTPTDSNVADARDVLKKLETVSKRAHHMKARMVVLPGGAAKYENFEFDEGLAGYYREELTRSHPSRPTIDACAKDCASYANTLDIIERQLARDERIMFGGRR